jgi:hypothetical protein
MELTIIVNRRGVPGMESTRGPVAPVNITVPNCKW